MWVYVPMEASIWERPRELAAARAPRGVGALQQSARALSSWSPPIDFFRSHCRLLWRSCLIASHRRRQTAHVHARLSIRAVNGSPHAGTSTFDSRASASPQAQLLASCGAGGDCTMCFMRARMCASCCALVAIMQPPRSTDSLLSHEHGRADHERHNDEHKAAA